jgi:iron complex transport system substrate-binding protein
MLGMLYNRVRRPLVRLLRTALSALVVLLLASGCSGSGSEDSGSGDPAPTTEAGAEDAFPLTVEHRFGTTTVEEAPTRVATVGLTDHDAVLALGVTPVGTTDWYGGHPFGVWPWAQDELGDAEPTVLSDGEFTGTPIFDFEEIRRLEPDLIIGLYTELDADQYEQATNIAPTVVAPETPEDAGSVWKEVTRTVGAALGQPARADELVEEIETQLADAAEAHPEFEGQEAVVAEVFEPGLTFARGGLDPRTQLLEALGFVLAPSIAADGAEAEGIEVSDEQMDLLDNDLIVWNVGFDETARAQIEEKPLYETLQVVQDGRSVFVEDPIVSGALTWGTVLSIPYALDELVPLLASAYE